MADDDVPPEMIEASRKRRAEVQAELAADAKARHDGVTRRSQLRGMSTADLEALAAKHGVDITTIGEVQRHDCPVCDGADTVDDAPIGVVAIMCDEHGEAVTRRVAEATLRPIIPVDVHEATTADLLPQLAAWTPVIGGIYLHGPVGTGKSHQAAALMKRAWAHLYRQSPAGQMPSVAWQNVPMMMDAIAMTFGTRKQYDMGPTANAQLLVLDDLGLADNMAFAVRKLYSLIEHRLHGKLVTIVTSNRNLDDLSDHLDSPQIASRLAQMCAQIDFDGMPDRRLGLAPTLPPPPTEGPR